MQFKLSFAVLAAVVTAARGAAIAEPIFERADALEARADQAGAVDGHIYICTDDQFSGACINYGFRDNQCSNFPSGFQDDISSVGPDQGWICSLYVNIDCKDGDLYNVAWPGFAHLDYGNDAFSAVRCVRQ